MGIKEHLLGNIVKHDPKAKAVSYFGATSIIGFGGLPGPAFEKGPVGGGYDGFGVLWEAPDSGAGAVIPSNETFLLDDITKWRDVVKFPDLEAQDWDEIARIEWAGAESTGGYDPKKKILDFGFGNGVFERLVALMGFEETLVALYEEPEECAAFFDALTDWKIAYLDKVKAIFNPDVATYYDDICTQNNPFMAPDVYRELIKPYHKRFAQACVERGIAPIYHCCGHAEMLIEDFIDCGWAAWSSVQPCNDIVSLCRKYGDRICIIGGYDTTGKPGWPDATDKIKKAEVRRCFREYGHLSGYLFLGFYVTKTQDPGENMKNMMPIIVESVVQSMVPRRKERRPA